MEEDDEFLLTRPPRRPGQEPTSRITRETYGRMRVELEGLRSTGRERMGERLLRAREFGDIRENAEYDAAKNEQGLMEARIRVLEHQLRDPEIMEAPAGDFVQAGTVVSLRPVDEDDPEVEEYLLAHSAEERAPGCRTVTSSSPLGSALLGRRVGERVTYDAPAGEFTYEVVSLKPYVS